MLLTKEELADSILDVIAHAAVAWTMGSHQVETDEFQDLKKLYRNLPGNKYKAELIADWLEVYR